MIAVQSTGTIGVSQKSGTLQLKQGSGTLAIKITFSPGDVAFYILREDDTNILREDDTNFLREENA